MRLVNGNYCVTYGCIRGIYAFPEISYSVEYQGHDKHINTLVDSLSLEIMCSCHVMFLLENKEKFALWWLNEVKALSSVSHRADNFCPVDVIKMSRSLLSFQTFAQIRSQAIGKHLFVSRPGQPQQLKFSELFGHWKELKLWWKPRTSKGSICL